MASAHAEAAHQRIDALLGQPQMVNDPRISTAQAAEILGKTPAQVYRLVRLGRLRRRGAPNKFRALLLSDVLRYRERGEPIKLNAAAKILQTSVVNVRAVITSGQLALVPGSQRLVYPGDVHRLARTWDRPSKHQPRQPPGPAGHINTEAAARLLGCTVARTRRLAAAELLPSQRDRQGRYWFRPDQLELIRRARRAAEANHHLWAEVGQHGAHRPRIPSAPSTRSHSSAV